MRKEYGKVLRQYFGIQMKKFLPDYKEVKVKSQYLGTGERCYSKSQGRSVNCWIVLSPSQKGYDEFTIMVGWSVLGRYPELNMIPSIVSPSSDRKEFSLEEYLIRLPQLWTKDDIWWVVKKYEPAFTPEELQALNEPISLEDAEDMVIPQVDNAMQKLLDEGIPYLSEFAGSKTE